MKALKVKCTSLLMKATVYYLIELLKLVQKLLSIEFLLIVLVQKHYLNINKAKLSFDISLCKSTKDTIHPETNMMTKLLRFYTEQFHIVKEIFNKSVGNDYL